MRTLISARVAIMAALCLGVLTGWAADARACECVAGAPACIAAPRTRAVFVGRVAGWAAGEVLFDVERAVRGVKRGRIRLDSGSGNCAFPFRTGERYVVYAHWDESLGSLTTSICSRTGPLSDPRTRGDLAYFDLAHDHQPSAGLITGVVYGATRTQAPTMTANRTLAGVLISASSPDGQPPRTTFTDADGSYVFRGMAAGTWRLWAQLPQGFLAHESAMVTVSRRDGCAEANIYARLDEQQAERP